MRTIKGRAVKKTDFDSREAISKGDPTRREFTVRLAMGSRGIISCVIVNRRLTSIWGMDSPAIIDNRAVTVRMATGDRKTNGRATATSTKGITGRTPIKSGMRTARRAIVNVDRQDRSMSSG